MFLKRILLGVIILFMTGCSSTQTSMPVQGGGKYSPRVVDPVCAYYADMGCILIVVDDSTLRSVYNGGTYYFCSAECKEDFDKHPEKFMRKVEKAPKGSVDPVCKAPVDTMDSPSSCLDNGGKVFFCSDHCRSKYLTSPERYRGK